MGDISIHIDPNGGRYLNNTGISTNSVPYGTTLAIDTPTRGGYQFDGWESTPIQFTGSQVYDLGRTYMYTDRLSWNIWARMEEWSQFTQKNMKLISCTEAGGWNLEDDNGNLIFYCYDAGVGYKSAETNVLTANLSSGWHMFSFVFDGTNAIGYVDGQQVGKSTAYTSGQIGYNTSNTIILGREAGASAGSSNGNYFIGDMKKVEIENVAWSPTDIWNKFINTPNSYNSVLAIVPTTIGAQWSMDYGMVHRNGPDGFQTGFIYKYVQGVWRKCRIFRYDSQYGWVSTRISSVEDIIPHSQLTLKTHGQLAAYTHTDIKKGDMN